MKIKRNDIILICCLLAMAAVLLLFIRSVRETGTQVTVYIDGEEYRTFPAGRDTEFNIVTDRGTNILVIKQGEAFLSDADCPDRLCVNRGSISHAGETIVCLPHKVVIAMENEEKTTMEDPETGVDIIAG